jgi:(2R)-3-sulfolactate dehydrogenase (NADP+)
VTGTVLAPGDLLARVDAALRRAGAGDVAAASVARSVARAEEDGIRPVGLGYLPIYLAHLRSGKVDGHAVPAVATPRYATITVDAANGFAHPAFDAGLTPLVAAARARGVAALAIRRSYSIGVLGHPVEDVATRGLVALAFTNSPPNVAPWGGRRKLFGTNPLALAAPRPGAPPLVIDMATTTVTKVALSAAAARGEPIPLDWALDADGRPTSDPKAGLAGSMQPFGGRKGALLSLIVEILGAALVGANLSKDAHPYALPEGPPPGVGQLILALDPDAFAEGFLDRIAELCATIAADEGARVPGDGRLTARARARTDGIPLDETLIRMLDT